MGVDSSGIEIKARTQRDRGVAIKVAKMFNTRPGADSTAPKTCAAGTPDVSTLIEQSQAMLRHAEAGDWGRLAEDELVRRQLIDKFFSEPANLANESDLSGALKELIKINDRMQQLTVEARERAKGEAERIGIGRKAVSAYAQNSR